MDVRRVVSAPFEVNVYVVEHDGRVLVVDASSGLDWDDFAPRLAEAIGDAKVEAVYLTHLHVDHVGGAARLARLTGAPMLMHEDEADAVERGDAALTGGALFGVPQEACPVTRVRTGDLVPLGPLRFEVVSLPGHSPGHSALFEPATRALFSGDVVFEGGSFGRVDLPGADAATLIDSLARVVKLEPAGIYPGHMRPITSGAKDAAMESLDNARLWLA